MGWPEQIDNLFAVIILSVFSSLDGDRKVIKSVGRILSIWEERGVYSGSLITELKSTLIKAESPPETPVEQKSECTLCLNICIAVAFLGYFYLMQFSSSIVVI